MGTLHHCFRHCTIALLLLLALPSLGTRAFAQGSLVASYPFDGNANDASGNNHHGTVNGPILVADRFGNPNSAYAFDGNDWIEVQHHEDLTFGPTDVFTINAWVKACTTQDEFAGVVAKGRPDTFIPGYQLVIRDGLPEALITRDQNQFVGVLGTKPILDSAWHMLTLIVDAPREEVRLYVDGVLNAVGTGTNIDPSYTNEANLFIGKERNSWRFAKGAIDDVSIFDYRLTDADITELYKEGGWPFFAGGGSLSIATPDGTSYCRSGSLRLIASGSLRYRWSPATGLSNPNIANPIASPTVTTTYTVTGLREDFPCGTTLTAQVTITVGDPRIDLGPDRILCTGGSVRIDSIARGGTGPYSYQWSPATGVDNPTGANPTLTPAVTTDYIVTVTDAQGCVGRDTIRVVVAPLDVEIEPALIDFGTDASCSTLRRDTLIVIRNRSTIPLTIAPGIVGAPFSIVAPTLPAVVPANDSIVLTVRSEPPADGMYEQVLQLPYDNGTCRDTFDVLLRHRRIGAGLTITGRSDYGRTFAGQVVDGRQVVRNATQADVTVDSITVGAPFVVTSTVPAVPTVLRPGDSIVVITRYVASGSVDTVDLFVHTSAPCATRTGLQLRAAGDERAFCRVYIPLISAPIGAALDIPLMIDSASALESAGAYRFTATISFDQTLLYPEPHVSMSTSDGLRRVVVTGTRRDGSNVLALIPSTAMLGRVDTTDLTIESFEWIEPLVEFPTTTVDGIFWLENNCPEGGERQYIKSGVVILKPISPNPVAGAAVASFELVEPGRTRLTISDALGKLVSVVLDDDAVAGSFAIPLDLQSLLPGSYLLVLETPTQIRSQRFEVIR